MNKNPDCSGGHCLHATGPVKLYPLGGGGNLILCRACWNHENEYRIRRGSPENWPALSWDNGTAYVVDAEDIKPRAARLWPAGTGEGD